VTNRFLAEKKNPKKKGIPKGGSTFESGLTCSLLSTAEDNT
jgi:hypothetical protein